MSTRPPTWQVTVENIDRGWTLIASDPRHPDHAEPDDALPQVTELSCGWEYAVENFPGQPEMNQGSLSLWAPTAATMPALEQGDLLHITWKSYNDIGQAGEPVWVPFGQTAFFDLLATEPVIRPLAVGRGLALNVGLVDPLAPLAEQPIGAPPWPVDWVTTRLQRIATAAGLTLSFGTPAEWVNAGPIMGPLDTDSRRALDLILTAIGGLYLASQYVAFKAEAGMNLTTRKIDLRIGGEPSRTYSPAFYKLVLGSDNIARLERVSNAIAPPFDTLDRLVIDAEAIDNGSAQYTSSRQAATNTVELRGLNIFDGEELATSVSHATLVARYGATVRRLTTQLSAGTADELTPYAAALLPDYDAATPSRTLTGCTLLPERLLWVRPDHGRLTPFHRLMDILRRPRPVAIVGIDPDQAVAGTVVHTHLIGCTYAIENGKFRPALKLLPTVQRPDLRKLNFQGTAQASDVATWERLRASAPLDPVVYRAASGPRLDPTVTLRDMRLTRTT